MARGRLAVEPPGHPIGLPTVAGGAVLLAVLMNEEAHPLAARSFCRLAVRALRVERKRMALPESLKLARQVEQVLRLEPLLSAARPAA
jgi:hypothetical protein